MKLVDYMIKSSALIDKLIADLHFHNYLEVTTRDNIFSDRCQVLDDLNETLASLGLRNQLDAYTDFYHGGDISNLSQEEHIQNYVDDVFIDYFFRSNKFKPIIFPKEFHCDKITTAGIERNLNEDIVLNMNNLFDRCTFCHNISLMLRGLNPIFADKFPDNSFIRDTFIGNQIYGVHAEGLKIIHPFSFERELELFYPLYESNGIDKTEEYRGIKIIAYLKFLRDISYKCLESWSLPLLSKLDKYQAGYNEIKKLNFFGAYEFQDLLFLYALLIDKFKLTNNSFLIGLCHLSCYSDEISCIISDFIKFEFSNIEYKILEPYIFSKDLYLRFTSPIKSRAVNFEIVNAVIKSVRFFQEEAINFAHYNNTLPLPYLYHNLKL